MARRVSASRATFSLGTPDSSNITRPGLMFAIHHSGEPLPEPMRVSAGFFVRRTVRVDVDPDLAATLDVAGHRDTSGLDLPVGHVVTGSRAWMPHSPNVTAWCHPSQRTGTVRVVLLAVLHTTGDEHGSGLRSGWSARPRQREPRQPARAAAGAAVLAGSAVSDVSDGCGRARAVTASGRPSTGRPRAAEQRGCGRAARGRARGSSRHPCRSTPSRRCGRRSCFAS